jgi:hypothetical protein
VKKARQWRAFFYAQFYGFSGDSHKTQPVGTIALSNREILVKPA